MRKSSQNSSPEISVVIVNYNTGRLLAECVGSIFKTTGNLKTPKVEVVVVDNASTDNSLEKGLSAKLPITVIRNKKNVGFAKAVNRGIKKSEGKHILLLNPDTRVEDGALQALVEFAEMKGGVGVVGAKLLNPDGKIQPSVYNRPTIWRAVKEYWLGQKGAFEKYAPDTQFPTEVEAVVGGAFLITREALRKVGLLDERYFMYFEDLDYCRRVRRAGLSVYYLPEARVVHYHGVSGKKLATLENQWRRLIPGSKTYHGRVLHYLINFIIWTGQKWRRLHE